MRKLPLQILHSNLLQCSVDNVGLIMILNAFALGILLISGWTMSSARMSKAGISQAHSKPIAEMDFELVNGRIYVPGKIKGHAVRVILDSGSGPNAVDLRLSENWNLKSTGRFYVTGVGPKTVFGRVVGDEEVRIGGIATSLSCAVPLDALTNSEGRAIQCIVGFPFLKEHVVEVDYARKHLKVFGKKTTQTPPGTAVPVQLVDGIPYLDANMSLGAISYKVTALIDSGSTSVSLSERFTKQHAITVPTTPAIQAGGGVGGIYCLKEFRLTSVNFMGIDLANPVANMQVAAKGVLGSESTFDLLIGFPLLERYVVTYDYPENRIYFDPNFKIFEPFLANRTGLTIRAYGHDLRSYRVDDVVKGSSAAKAGMKVGDFIERIDGLSTSKISLSTLRDQFDASTKLSWNLLVRRGIKVIEVNVKAQEII